MATSPMSQVIRHFRRTVVQRDGASLTDGQLLEEYISRRDEAALAALVRRHAPMVWGVCRRVLRNHHDAEDASQATFLVFVRRAASITSRELLANWLYGVAHQTALKARATVAKRKGREKQVAEMPEPAVAERGLWYDLNPLLDQELSRLPDRYRSVLVLCDLEGKTRKETAGQLGVPEGTVAGWLARAREMLAKRLGQRGVALSGGALAAVFSQNVASAGVPAAVVSNTIEAATLFAAGKAATGAISFEVAALTEGVLKTMILTKLKLATAVLFVASTIALTCGVFAGQQPKGSPDEAKAKPPIKSAERPKEDKDKLQGTWRLIRAENDGVTIGKGRPEIEDNLLVFHESSVTLSGKTIHDPRIRKEPEDTKSIGAFALDIKKNPKAIAIVWTTNPWNDKKDFSQKAIYSLDGDTLQLCTSVPNEEKQTLPSDFSANFGSKRLLWTFKRDPTPKKGGKKTDIRFPDGRDHNLGKVKRGTLVKHAFRIVNDSNVPLQIASVRVSSGCMTGSASEKVLQPKEDGKVEVAVDAGRFTGSKTILLFLEMKQRGTAETFEFSITVDSVEAGHLLVQVEPGQNSRKQDIASLQGV